MGENSKAGGVVINPGRGSPKPSALRWLSGKAISVEELSQTVCSGDLGTFEIKGAGDVEQQLFKGNFEESQFIFNKGRW